MHDVSEVRTDGKATYEEKANELVSEGAKADTVDEKLPGFGLASSLFASNRS